MSTAFTKKNARRPLAASGSTKKYNGFDTFNGEGDAIQHPVPLLFFFSANPRYTTARKTKTKTQWVATFRASFDHNFVPPYIGVSERDVVEVDHCLFAL